MSTPSTQAMVASNPAPASPPISSPILAGALELCLPWALVGVWGLLALPVLLAEAASWISVALFASLLGVATLFALLVSGWQVLRRLRVAADEAGGSAWATQGVPFAGVAGVSHPEGGARIVFRAGRHPWVAAASGLLGCTLGAVAAWLATAGVDSLSLGDGYRALLAAHFALAGFAALTAALYQIGNSLEVRVERGRLRVVRRCLGLTLSQRAFDARGLQRFQVSGLSQLHAENRFGHYHIRALLSDGRRVTVGESLGKREAAVALGQHLSDWLGLHGRAARRGRRTGTPSSAAGTPSVLL